MKTLKYLLTCLFNLFYPPEKGDEELTDNKIWAFGGIIAFFLLMAVIFAIF